MVSLLVLTPWSTTPRFVSRKYITYTVIQNFQKYSNTKVTLLKKYIKTKVTVYKNAVNKKIPYTNYIWLLVGLLGKKNGLHLNIIAFINSKNTIFFAFM